MDMKNITWIISIAGWACLVVYIAMKYRSYKQMDDVGLKRLVGEMIFVQTWQAMIFLMMLSDKVDFIVARY